LHDPYLLSGMKTAVRRIKKAIYNKEQIAILVIMMLMEFALQQS